MQHDPAVRTDDAPGSAGASEVPGCAAAAALPAPARRAWLQAALAGAAAALGARPLRAQPAADDRPLPAVGTPLALPEVALLDGSRFLPARADGQVLVLYWWASWCPFCAAMSPLIDELWRAQAARGLMVLGLSIDKAPADALAYLRRKELGFPSGMVTAEVARALPKPKGLPVTVVRGRDGRVRMAEAGQLFPEDVQDIARFL
ncbi:MAG: TlpA family protein disulfide reductase [Burkholderiales bacterium]|nr:TlpA family protein disulfide reductase [Burkholderiales bacterium]